MYSSPAALPLIISPPTLDIRHCLVKCFTNLWLSFWGSDIIGAVINHTKVVSVMCASLKAFSFLCIFTLVSIPCCLTALVRVGQQKGLWCSFGCRLLLQSFVYYRAPCHSNNISEYILWNFPHEISWLMSFTHVESRYWSKALSALCCCSISSDCLLSEECTQAEQPGVGTVLIESEESACCWPSFGGHDHVNDHILYMLI